MYWVCTTFMTGLIFSAGWCFGKELFERLIDVIDDAPDEIRRMKRKHRRTKRMQKRERVNYYHLD